MEDVVQGAGGENTSTLNATENVGKTAFTPGPWVVVPPSRQYPSRAMVAGASGSEIYDAPLTSETQANARLIAAAPDLYAACEAVLEMAVGPVATERTYAILEQVQAATKKARGESA